MRAEHPSLADLLDAAAHGDREALDAVFVQVYPELRRLAHQVRAGRAGETLDTTALAHEAYLKMAAGREVAWQGRAHFLAVAARAMRQILVDAARRHGAAKRGQGQGAVTLDDGVPSPPHATHILGLQDALTRLESLDSRLAAVVEHRFFGGLTAQESAEVLGVSVSTVERSWRVARAWLAAELEP